MDMETVREVIRRVRGGEAYQQHASIHREGGSDPVGIIVEETDASPSVKNVTRIKLTPGSLTDNGDGSVSISTSGTGAPTDAPYLTTGYNGALSAESVLTAGTGITLTPSGTPGSTGIVTIASTTAAIAGAQFVVIAADPTLTGERVLTPGVGVQMTDGGANGPVTLTVQPIAGTGISITSGGAGVPVTISATGSGFVRTYLPFGSCGPNGYSITL